MPLQLDHLSRDQLRELLESAVSLLPASRRRQFLETIPDPPVPPPPSPKALAHVVEVAEDLQTFLDDHVEAVEAWMGDDWNQDSEFDEEHYALQADLDEALGEAVAWLATQAPSDALATQVAEAQEAVRALMEWECESMGVPYRDMDPSLEHLEALNIWAWLLQNLRSSETDIASGLTSRWPRPVGPSLLSAVLGSKKSGRVLQSLTILANQGSDAAARWLLQACPDNEDLLILYAHLSPDLGQRWSEKMAQERSWGEILEGLNRGVAIPHDIQYKAALQLRRYDLAFKDVFDPGARVALSQVWDDAMAAGQLDLFRQVARTSSRPAARWIALDEPDLLLLPSKYDHSRVKAVVSYAIARASRGKVKSEAHAYELDEALLARLASAPGPHDEARCVDTALTGLEQMMAFHIEGRSRNRYTRAAAYWVQHGVLCEMYGLLPRHARLRTVFVAELHRLPALRDELNQARARWK